jgi:hydroxyethylthiazole kinase-like uncharacterized protein yjeF
MLILNTKHIRAIENAAFEAGLPVASLMEKAGLALFFEFHRIYSRQTHHHVGLLAGPGHNGGDALVLARELLLSGRKVTVWSPFSKRKNLTANHLAWYESLGGTLTENLSDLIICDVLVDGLLGFGLDTPPSGFLREGILWLNIQKSPVVSLDVPSGLCSDTGVPLDIAVKATHTLMLTPRRIGLYEAAALPYCGELIPIEIGLTDEFCNHIVKTISPNALCIRDLNCEKSLQTLFARPSPNATKYTSGRALILAGSLKYPGAAVLAALACRSAGPGFIAIETVSDAQIALLSLAPDLVFVPQISGNFPATTPEHHKKYDAILCGCGIDNDQAKLNYCFSASTTTLILDADALNMMAAKNLWPHSSANVIITPHEAEFARLFPKLAHHAPRCEAAFFAAQKTNSIVVLKGERTVIASPTGEVFINTQTTPALAKAGTGDVLAGLITAFAARGLSPLEAAKCGVWLHSQRALEIEATLSASHCNAMRLATHAPCVD